MEKTEKIIARVQTVQPFIVNGVPVDTVTIDLNNNTVYVSMGGNQIAALPIKQGAVTVEYAIII